MRYIKQRLSLSTALIFILCGCSVAGGQQNLPPAIAVIDSCRVVDSTGTGCASQNVLTDLAQARETSACLETSLARKEGVRGAILAELARLFFTRGEMAIKSERLVLHEKGRHYAELLCREEPKKVEGYYWLALNLCGICELSRAGRALSMVPAIVENLELALAIDKSFDQGGPPRLLGRIRFQAPPWPLSEGDLKESLNLLRIAAKIAPDNSTNHLYLAETLIQLGEAKEACAELDRALGSKFHAFSSSGLEEDQAQALTLITRCGSTFGENAAEKGKNFAGAVKETAQ
ncbi:MAG: tetratricopeptide repeat protein [Syntrophobacteraceae bacterium]